MKGVNASIGKLIGDYRIAAIIYNGPFSCVYRGEHQAHTERSVAIKLCHSIRLSQQGQHHLLREARLLKLLKHPHLLPILDIGIHENTPYQVTEYAPRGSLRDHINRQSSRSVPVQESSTILSQIGQALQYVHQLNIIHGNLKPENILFAASGNVLLTDFTIHILLDSAGGAYKHNIGSARYLAPEQFQGIASKASDQYALGCIGYELFTGSVPFSAADFSALGLKHAKEIPPAPTQLNMLLPIRMEEAILKALAKQQDARHGSIKDFIAALGTASIFQARLLAIPAAPRTALPAISSTQSHAPLTSIVDTSLEIKHEAADEEDSHGGPERRQAPSAIQQNINMPLPLATPELYEEEDQEVVNPLSALAELFEDRAESAQVHTNTVTKQDEVSEQDTVISPIIEVSQPQSVSRELVTRPMVVVVNSQAELVIGTRANFSQTTPPITWSKIGRSRRSGNQGSRYLWIAVTISSIVIAAIVISLSSFALSTVLSPKMAARVTPQTPPGGPSKVPSQVPSPMIPATPSPQPSPRPIPTPKSTPTPLPTTIPTPTPNPTPTPSPTLTPTPGLIVTPSQFNAATDCTLHAHWYTCTTLLSVPQTYQSNVTWSASSSGLGQVSINPSAGELSPGQEQQVTIIVRNNCPITGSLIFSGGGSMVTVPWSC
jgi:serine/threonine protein kinase